MQKYTAKIIDFFPASKEDEVGLYYPTFQYYDQNNEIKTAVGKLPMERSPFSMKNEYLIVVDNNGNAYEQKTTKPYFFLAAFIIGFFVCGLTIRSGAFWAAAITLIVTGIPLYNIFQLKTRSNEMQDAASNSVTVFGTIVNYRITKKTKDGYTTYYNHPNIEYEYNGETYIHPSVSQYVGKDPTYVGGKRALYLSENHNCVMEDFEVEDVSDDTIKGLLRQAIVTFCVFAAFFGIIYFNS
jgi:hypothetical protein